MLEDQEVFEFDDQTILRDQSENKQKHVNSHQLVEIFYLLEKSGEDYNKNYTEYIRENIEDSTEDGDKKVSIENINENVKANNSFDVIENIDAKKVCIEDFEFRRFLGAGGFGKVYQVEKICGTQQGKIFAMKVQKKTVIVHDEEANEEKHINKSVKLERDVLLAVRHPFIVDLHYAFQAGGKLYLVMEYLPGGELFMQLEKEGRMMEDAAIFYLSQVVLAIEHLHKQGIIYRDLKPENIMLDREGYIKLTDFGCAKKNIYNENDYILRGTIEYMAPEILNGSGRQGKEVDWWSLGVLIHNILTGDVLFTGSTQIIKKKILGYKFQPKIYPYLTSSAKDVLRKLLQGNVKDRLGHGENGAKAVKNHRFFDLVDWDDVIARKCEPPFVPQLEDENDISNFDNKFTCLPALDSPPGLLSSQSVEDIFIGFSYSSSVV